MQNSKSMKISKSTKNRININLDCSWISLSFNENITENFKIQNFLENYSIKWQFLYFIKNKTNLSKVQWKCYLPVSGFQNIYYTHPHFQQREKSHMVSKCYESSLDNLLHLQISLQALRTKRFFINATCLTHFND